MEMIEYIKQYYQSERNMSFAAAAIGLTFLLIALVAYRQYGFEQFNRGLIFTLSIGGLFLLSALAFAFQNSKKIEDVNFYTHTNPELQQAEIVRVEKVLETGYSISTKIASVLIVAGIALLLLSSGNLLRGIGLGILLFGTAMHTIDFFSINNHKIYLETIRELKY
jgi:hypothetical protein